MDKIVFVSQIAKNNFSKLFDVDTSKYSLYNILDLDKVRKLALTEISSRRLFTITAIGSLIEVKGIDRLVRVAKKLKDDGSTFCIQIVGRGGKEKELLELRNNLGLEQDVHFCGFQTNPYPYLNQSDLLVSTSISEGLSYVICEALALGVPVVATETAGAMELLEGGKYGILTNHNDEAIYQGIKEMMDNPDLRKMYSDKGKKRAESFSAQQIMSEFYKLLQ